MTTRFDECLSVEIDGEAHDLVVHRDAKGASVWHSPLTEGALSCVICEHGARVYVRGTDST